MPNLAPPQENQTQLTEGYVIVWADVSPDGMQAFISGQAGNNVDRFQVQNAITQAIRERGIRHGLFLTEVREAIDRLCRGEEVKNLLIAQATPPQLGRDARIEVMTTLSDIRPKALVEEYKMDFRDRGGIPVVRKNTPIATLYPEEPGLSGRNVLGAVLVPRPPRILRLRQGKGVAIINNGRLAVAATGGMVVREQEDKFEIKEVYIVRGDLDFSVGNINFPGAVKVVGKVLQGFRVQAFSLEAEALEPGSQVETTGSVHIRGGILGATVKAGGMVSAMFVNQADMACDGNLTVHNEIVNSKIACNGKVTVTAEGGRIITCQIAAMRGVKASKIMSSGGPTVLRLDARPEFKENIFAIQRKVEHLTEECKNLQAGLEADKSELASTERELREALAKLKDPEQNGNYDNLLAQANMIAPLYKSLKQGIQEGEAKLADNTYSAERMSDLLADLKSLLPKGNVWLDVLALAEAGTEILGPNSSLTLERDSGALSIRETAITCRETGSVSYELSINPLRGGA